MAITQALCNSFKQEVLEGGHNFASSGGNTFKLALYESSATLGAGTTAYAAPSDAAADPTSTYEVSTTGTNYTSGGQALTNNGTSLSGTTAFVDFADEVFSSVTLTAAGCLIYNSSQSDTAVIVLSFGGDKTATNGDFTIQFPTADSSNALIRIT